MDDRMSSLVEISKTINSILELDKLLETIMDSAIAAVGVERGIIFLRNTGGALEVRVARNVERETVQNAEEVSRSIMAEVASSGRYFHSSNLQTDPSTMERPSVRAFKILSVLCIPLIEKDTTVGTIYLDSRRATKSFSEEDIQFMLAFANLAAVAIQNAKLFESTRNEAKYWKGEASQRYGFEHLVYSSREMAEVSRRAKSVAASNVSVLITGESGTGKELVARAIHTDSRRREERFIPINCGAMPEQILESELFGVKKGAFTGAVADKKGLFEEADHGTIFLDEIADMQPMLQAKLLRVLQEGEVRRVGDTSIKIVDVRVISATNKDITREIAEKRFREDLYHRLCGTRIDIPALRFRREDIGPLTHHFVQEFCEEQRIPMKKISLNALARLNEYSFTGNVRELRNVIQNAVLFAESEIDDVHLHFSPASLQSENADDFNEATRQLFIKVLQKVDWNQSRAAEILGLNRTTFQAKLKKLNISRPS